MISLRSVKLNGAVQKVPQAESLVVEVMLQIGKPAFGAQIAMESGKRLSAASVYQLVKRLMGRGLVNRLEQWDTSGSVPVLDVKYELIPGITTEIQAVSAAQVVIGKINGGKTMRDAVG